MSKKPIALASICLAVFLLFSSTTSISAQDPDPWIIVVNSAQDLPDIAQNSVCSAITPTGGPCTLRAALHEANLCDESTCPGGVMIQIPPMEIWLTLVGAEENAGATGDLDINNLAGKQIIIEGDPITPPVILGNFQDRVFDVISGLVGLRNLIVTYGQLVLSSDDSSQSGAGIRNFGALELIGVHVELNQIICVPADIPDCYQAVGGGIANYGTLTINMSTVRGNHAARGGGIFNVGGAGGLTIYNTSFYDNVATKNGGALVSYAPVSMLNSTISNNLALEYNGGIENNQTMNLANITIASNTTNFVGAANLVNEGTLNIRNSIIAYPAGPLGTINCQTFGVWNSTGYNLFGDASCPATSGGDVINTDPKLTELGNWGGWNWTRGLLAGSPAHDRRPGFCTEFVTNYTVTSDQRGMNRDALCDNGAVEGVIGKLYLPVIKR